MVRREYDPMLDPFCQYCGEYKGVGQCSNSDCKIGTVSVSRKSCSRCDKASIALCKRCGKGFCKSHSEGVHEGQLIGKDHLIGTCSICGEMVCENCWILDDDGKITCFVHMVKEHTP